jgi:hypothetical protein
MLALDTFMVGATFKRTADADQNCAFLCHVSTRTTDHRHIENLLRKYKNDLASGLRGRDPKVLVRLKRAYDELASTHEPIANTDFNDLVEAIAFLSPGISVKLVNGETDEDVAVRSPYNLFVGGNKLGRGVTIKNLLVSYYGRNPKAPQADTVLQHARMYGYRRKDIGLLRLFLPKELHTVFRAINKMERSLRDLISSRPSEEFRCLYVERGLNATRKNVLAPGAIGVYTGGGSYNPSQVLRSASTVSNRGEIDSIVAQVSDGDFSEFPLDAIKRIIELTMEDEAASERVWDRIAISESIKQYAELRNDTTGYIYVDRERDLQQSRRETQGILSGGEANLVPKDKVTLFLLRTSSKNGQQAAWWPQIRFADGGYAFAFAI